MYLPSSFSFATGNDSIVCVQIFPLTFVSSSSLTVTSFKLKYSDASKATFIFFNSLSVKFTIVTPKTHSLLVFPTAGCTNTLISAFLTVLLIEH